MNSKKFFLFEGMRSSSVVFQEEIPHKFSFYFSKNGFSLSQKIEMLQKMMDYEKSSYHV
jgi:hypothetical protein